MTTFAGKRFMKSGALLLAHVVMAISADARARELDCFRGLSLDCGLPVKPALDKGRWDDVIPQRDDRDNQDGHDNREPSYLLGNSSEDCLRLSCSIRIIRGHESFSLTW
jgi:hypothetical protein